MIIFGIDPGSTFMGISIYHIDDYTLNINMIESVSLSANKIDNYKVWNNDIVERLYYLDIQYRRLLNIYNPVAITVENPFINRFRPGSVIPLAKNLALIENSTREYDNSILINRISPSEAKNAIKAKGNALKDEMTLALKNSGLLDLYSGDITALTEHEVDAIAIGYSLYLLILQCPHILL